MDYLKTYYRLIETRRLLSRDCYLEHHHIVPRSIYGKGLMKELETIDLESSDNLVYLTGREHFIAHWLLHRAFPKEKNLAAAFHAMANMSNKHHFRYTPSSRAIEEARKAYAELQRLPVAMYSLDGKLLKVFGTTAAAAKEVNSSRSNISAACNEENQVNNIKGFQWRRFHCKPLQRINKYVNQNEKNEISIHEYNLKGEYIRSHNSIRAAARKGFSRSALKKKFRNKPIFSKDKWYVISTCEPQKEISVSKRNTQRRRVLQIDPKTGEIIRIWNSTREPKRALGISNVHSVCSGKRKTMGGFIWKYEEEDSEIILEQHIPKLSRATKIEVFKNGKSLGQFLSLRKAETSTGIPRIILSALVKMEISNYQDIIVKKI